MSLLAVGVDDGQDLVLAQDDEVGAVELDLAAGVLAHEDPSGPLAGGRGEQSQENKPLTVVSQSFSLLPLGERRAGVVRASEAGERGRGSEGRPRRTVVLKSAGIERRPSESTRRSFLFRPTA